MTSFAQINDNFRHRRWIDPIDTRALVCSKLITKLLTIVVPLYNKSEQYKSSLSVLNSLEHCAPDSWGYYHLMSRTLLGLNFQDKAIGALEKATERHPKGEYQNHTTLYVTYYNTKNIPKASELYQKFSAEPEALLAIQAQTTVDLVAMSVDANNLQQATKFYQMHVKYHGENAQLEKTYQKLAQQDASEN